MVFILITLDIVSCLVIDHVFPPDKALRDLESETTRLKAAAAGLRGPEGCEMKYAG